MDYSKHKSFGESNANQEIDFNQYETSKDIDCYLNLSFREDSFIERESLNKFIKGLKRNVKRYFPDGDLSILKDNSWININLNFAFENEENIKLQQISNYHKYTRKINNRLKKISMNSLDELISETGITNPMTNYKEYKNEIEQYLGNESEFGKFERTHIPIIEEYLEKQTNYIKRMSDLLDKGQLKEYYVLGKEYDEFLPSYEHSLNPAGSIGIMFVY